MQPMSDPTIAEIEREVVHMAYVVERYGERYRPILDSLTSHFEARQERLVLRERSMPKRPRPLPDRSEISDDTPLHLDTAARLAFPDGVVSGLALRNAAARGDLEYERLGGRIVTTLRFISEWRARNRHPAKPSAELPKPEHLADEHRAASMAAAYRAVADIRAKPKEGRPEDAHQAASAALEAKLRALIKPKSEKDGKSKIGRARRPKG